MRAVAVILAAFVVMTGPVPSEAAPVTGAECAKELDLRVPSKQDAAKLTPVVMVHGYTGNTRIWSSMSERLKYRRGFRVVEPFNYHNTSAQWVATNPAAQELTQTIVCYSKLYGGKRIIVVAHSMGALLTLEALDRAAYGVFAKNAAGHLITLGALYRGSG